MRVGVAGVAAGVAVSTRVAGSEARVSAKRRAPSTQSKLRTAAIELSARAMHAGALARRGAAPPALAGAGHPAPSALRAAPRRRGRRALVARPSATSEPSTQDAETTDKIKQTLTGLDALLGIEEVPEEEEAAAQVRPRARAAPRPRVRARRARRPPPPALARSRSRARL